MKQTRLRSRPKRRLTDAEAALAWFVAVTRRKRCVICGTKRRLQGHHVIPQSVLLQEFRHGAILRDTPLGTSWFPFDPRRDVDTGGITIRTLEQLRWDVRNGIAICERDHQRHTDAVERIPYAKLSAAAREFARELNLQHRLGPRYYSRP